VAEYAEYITVFCVNQCKALVIPLNREIHVTNTTLMNRQVEQTGCMLSMRKTQV